MGNSLYNSITITILDNIRRPVFYLKLNSIDLETHYGSATSPKGL
jgi:hypothetical protein